ncbi:MAG: TetR/AcrR family transcriptional regulator [Raoultibacter sp.]
MDLVANASTQKRITVVEVANAVGINRKTFYNYFEGIDDLTIWIVRYYLKNMLEGPQFAGLPLVYPDKSLFDPYEDWPFYVRIKTDDHCLSQEKYFRAMAYHWEENRAYYTNMFHGVGCGYVNLTKYLELLYLPALREDMNYMLNGREMPEEAIHFLTVYHVVGMFGRLPSHFASTYRSIIQDDDEPFWNYTHIMLKKTIDSMFEQRVVGSLAPGSTEEKVQDVYTAQLR